MDGRNASKHRRVTHDFAFSGLIACGRCGCSVVGEIKKQKYIYYHCTGYADKCRGEPASCCRRGPHARSSGRGILNGAAGRLLGAKASEWA